MTDARPRLEPGPDHPISIEHATEQVTVRVGDAVVAESRRALVLREASYPPVYYLPEDDLRPGVVRPNGQRTYCPYKGEAAYYDLLPAGAPALEGAVWYYPAPYPPVGAIAGHVAFYPDRVAISVSPA